MKKLIRLKESRPVRLAPLAAAVVTAFAVASAIVAGPGNAASPRLSDGVLMVKGTEASDKIALRLQAGNPAIVQVDIGDDGSAEFSFERAEIAEILRLVIGVPGREGTQAHRRQQPLAHDVQDTRPA